MRAELCVDEATTDGVLEIASRQTNAITASESLARRRVGACLWGHCSRHRLLRLGWAELFYEWSAGRVEGAAEIVSERFRSLVIFFVHECVCHTEMGSRLGVALFRGEKKMSAGLAANTTALCFMRKGPPR